MGEEETCSVERPKHEGGEGYDQGSEGYEQGSEAESDEDQRCHIGSAVSGVEDSKKNYLVGNLNFLAVLVVKER